jgi:hypothetical protein
VTPTVHELTVRAIHDALALAGPGESGGYIRTSEVETYMDQSRLRLAREVAKSLPPGTTYATADAVAVKLAPMVRSLLTQ